MVTGPPNRSCVAIFDTATNGLRLFDGHLFPLEDSADRILDVSLVSAGGVPGIIVDSSYIAHDEIRTRFA